MTEVLEGRLKPEPVSKGEGRSPLAADAPVRSLSKGLMALDVLRAAGELRTTDLAHQLGVDKGAASRLLKTLSRMDYAERLPDRRYRIGSKLRHASSPASGRARIAPLARPLLSRLAAQTGEAAYLGLLVEGQVLYVDKVVPDTTLKVDRSIPTFSPIHCTAIGKVFLAFCNLPVPEVLVPHSPRTVTDPVLYQRQLDAVRRDGFAFDDEELHLGVRCVAAPLVAADGEVAGVLCLAAPSARLPIDAIDETGALTRSIANDFSLL